MQPINYLLAGAISIACLTATIFFLKFWRITKDRFFLFFAASFFMEAINRFALGVLEHLGEDAVIHYLVRALSYGLILIAILDKNFPRKGSDS